jgi:hypothetical protein
VQYYKNSTDVTQNIEAKMLNVNVRLSHSWSTLSDKGNSQLIHYAST